MSESKTGMSGDNGELERLRRQGGGGKHDPLPQSEKKREDQASPAKFADDPADVEPIRSATRNQSQVSPEDYEGSSQSGGSDRGRDKV